MKCKTEVPIWLPKSFRLDFVLSSLDYISEEMLTQKVYHEAQTNQN